jgi:cytochrome d ubiquinol oxidase subunit II
MPPSLLLAGIIVTAVTVYVLLAGADFGAGIWDLLASGPTRDGQKKLIETHIGPVWEVNHVWLIFVIVLLFSGFPSVFAALLSGLFVPILLSLVGIIFRGTAFTFRAYFTQGRRAQLLCGRVFSIASLMTPLGLGIIIGAIAQGSVPVTMTGDTNGFSVNWLSGFTVATGLFAAAIFAQLAAVYLLQDATHPALREIFRGRAIVASVVVATIALIVFLLSRAEARPIYDGLLHSRLAICEEAFTALSATIAFVALFKRRYRIAQVGVVLQTGLIVWGWALAQYPGMLGPNRMLIGVSAAPDNVVISLCVIAAGGALFLVPSLFFLLKVFLPQPALASSKIH